MLPRNGGNGPRIPRVKGQLAGGRLVTPVLPNRIVCLGVTRVGDHLGKQAEEHQLDADDEHRQCQVEQWAVAEIFAEQPADDQIKDVAPPASTARDPIRPNTCSGRDMNRVSMSTVIRSKKPLMNSGRTWIGRSGVGDARSGFHPHGIPCCGR